jgi:phosphoglycolate phosphatase
LKKVRLLIFDLDGTLLDTIEDLANSVNYALRCFGFPEHASEAYRFMIGNGVNKLLERALPEAHRHADGVSMMRHEFLRHYSHHADDCTRPYPGISELLQTLQNSGFQLGVASNKMHEATGELVKRFFPEINFILVLGQREGIPVKPAPDILLEIMATAGVEEAETLYIGDSGVDALTAINASVPFIGVLWGFRPQAELAQAGATHFVEKPEEILNVVKIT